MYVRCVTPVKGAPPENRKHEDIPVNPRRRGEGNGPEMEPDRAERFRKRSGVERFNSHLNDEHGGRTIRVRGHAKVALHLSFGVLVIAAEQILKLLA